MVEGSVQNADDLQNLDMAGCRSMGWHDLQPASQQQIRRAVPPAQPISGLFYPGNVAELAAAMTVTRDRQWQVLVCGAGSKLDWGGRVGRSTQPLVGVSTQHLNRLIDHAVGDLTVTVEAGMKFVDLQATLSQQGQFLAIDPAFPEQATLGGIVATADTGSLRQAYGGIRDMLLGISIVRADGQIAKAGGRVVKNVAGYDLMKLFTGSYGTLGIITQMTFRVYPLPQAAQTIVLVGASERLVQAIAPLLRSALTPTQLDLLSPGLTAALHLGAGMGLAIRFQSIQASVDHQVACLLELGQSLGLGAVSLLDRDETALWQRLRERMTVQPSGCTCKIGVKPSEAVAVLNQIEQRTTVPSFTQIHLGSGLGRLAIDASVTAEHVLNTRALLQTYNGFLSILQAPDTLKQTIDGWGYTGNALDLMQRIKRQFDPDLRLNPGRFIGG